MHSSDSAFNMPFDNGKILSIALLLEGVSLILIGIEENKLAEGIINACATGQLNELRKLMPQYHGKAATTMPTPQYLLQTAAQNGQAEAIRLLFDSLPSQTPPHHPWDPKLPAGVFLPQIPNKWRIYENSVVISALEGSDPLAVFRIFFDYGMKPDYNLERAGNTTSFAIASGKFDLVRFFLEKGAKLTGRYLQQEDTYLGVAARQQTLDVLKLLIDKGAELKGSQALRQAAQSGRVDNAKYLLGIGADVNELYTRYNIYKKKDEVTGAPLHWAVRGTPLNLKGKPVSKGEMVRFLLSKGAKPELVDSAGKTAFQVAREVDETEVIEVFKEHSVEN